MSDDDAATLIEAGRLEDALALCERMLEANAGDVTALINRGVALVGLGDAPAARRGFNKAINEDPTIAGAWNGLGKAFYDLGDPVGAAEAFRTAAALASDPAPARYHRGMALLLSGDFEAGWPEYEHRIDMPSLKLRAYDKPRWTGAPLDGKRLLVVAEQGYGDMIQFARFLPRASRCGGPVRFEGPAELLALFEPFAADVTMRASDTGPTPESEFDCYVHLMSLGRFFGATSDTPYIAAPPARARFWREELAGPGFKIGLAWAGRPSHPQDAQRSMDCAALAPLMDVPGVRYHSLQKDTSIRPLDPAVGDRLADDFGPLLTSFGETAAVVENLDLVITVDTALAHLAGALGKPVWILLPFAPDWRWMLGRDDTPWYPAMRLFRQTAPGEWTGVVARVGDALIETVG